MGTENLEKNLEAFCEDVEAYVEGRLSESRRREMDAFLESSEEARTLLAEFCQANAWFEDSEWEIEDPKHLPTAQAILDRARIDSPAWLRWWRSLTSWVPTPISSPVFATLLVAGVLLGITWLALNPKKKDLDLAASKPAVTSPTTLPEQEKSKTLNAKDSNLEGQSYKQTQPTPESPSASAPSPPAEVTSLKASESKSTNASVTSNELAKNEQPNPSPQRERGEFEKVKPGDFRADDKQVNDGVVMNEPSVAPPPPPKTEVTGGLRASKETTTPASGAGGSGPKQPAKAGDEEKSKMGILAGKPTSTDTTSSSKKRDMGRSEEDQDEKGRRAAGSEILDGSKTAEAVTTTRPAAPAQSHATPRKDQTANGRTGFGAYQKVRTVKLDLIVTDLEKTNVQFTSITQQFSGKKLSGKIDGTSRFSAISQVPAEKLSSYLTQLRNLGRVEKEHTEERDISRDVAAQEQRLNQALNTSAEPGERGRLNQLKSQVESVTVVLQARRP